METFRTLPNGVRQDNDNQVLDEELQPMPIRYTDATFTGTQLQTAFDTPLTIVSAVSGKTFVPIGWHCSYDHAGGTDFSGNATLGLYIGVIIGAATNAISGSADKLTVGTITSAAITTAADLQLTVDTGNPTGGHAGASLTVRVWYVLV